MKCPYCNNEMIRGDFKCASCDLRRFRLPVTAYFSQKPHLPSFPRKGDVPIRGNLGYVRGNLCEKCNKIIVDYSTIHEYEK